MLMRTRFKPTPSPKPITTRADQLVALNRQLLKLDFKLDQAVATARQRQYRKHSSNDPDGSRRVAKTIETLTRIRDQQIEIENEIIRTQLSFWRRYGV